MPTRPLVEVTAVSVSYIEADRRLSAEESVESVPLADRVVRMAARCSPTRTFAPTAHARCARSPFSAPTNAKLHAVWDGSRRCDAQTGRAPTGYVARLTPESDCAFTAPQVDARVRNEGEEALRRSAFDTGDGLDVRAEADAKASFAEARQRQILRARALGLLDDELAEQDQTRPTAAGAGAGADTCPQMKTLICDCNRTMPLDAQALGLALARPGRGG